MRSLPWFHGCIMLNSHHTLHMLAMACVVAGPFGCDRSVARAQAGVQSLGSQLNLQTTLRILGELAACDYTSGSVCIHC